MLNDLCSQMPKYDPNLFSPVLINPAQAVAPTHSVHGTALEPLEVSLTPDLMKRAKGLYVGPASEARPFFVMFEGKSIPTILMGWGGGELTMPIFKAAQSMVESIEYAKCPVDGTPKLSPVSGWGNVSRQFVFDVRVAV